MIEILKRGAKNNNTTARTNEGSNGYEKGEGKARTPESWELSWKEKCREKTGQGREKRRI